MNLVSADGFVVQTGDPEGPAEGFIDPSTEKMRTIPLEIMVTGKKTPFYGSTLEVNISPCFVSSRIVLVEKILKISLLLGYW